MPSLLHFAVGNGLFLVAVQLRRARGGWRFAVVEGGGSGARERAGKAKIGEGGVSHGLLLDLGRGCKAGPL